MNILSWIVDASFSTRLTLSLLHFLWQGCCCGLLVIIGGSLFGGVTARFRYSLSVAAMLLMAACLPVTFWLVDIPAVDSSAALSELNNPAVPAAAREDFRPSSAGQSIVSMGEMTEPDQLVPALNVTTETARTVPEVPTSSVTPTTLAANVFQSLSQWVTILYLSGVALILGRLLRGVWGGHRLRKNAHAIDDATMLKTVSEVARRLGFKSVPTVRWCGQISIPVVVGIVQPMILLPLGIVSGLTPSQLQALLLHELAHIRRFDPIVNLFQRIIEAVLFFHPMVWFVSRRINIEREHAADDMVLAAGWDRPLYADALVRVAELAAMISYRDQARHAAILRASGTSPTEFKLRVLRLLGESQPPKLGLSRAGAVATLLVIAMGGVFAWSQTDSQKPTPQPGNPADIQNTKSASLPAEDPVAKELERFQGIFAVVGCDSETKGLDGPQEICRHWRWTIKGDELTWFRSRDEVWKLSLKIDPTKSPKEIDLTYLDGPFQGQTCQGMYQWEGAKKTSLGISIQDPGATVARPRSISMMGGGQTSLIFVSPIEPEYELSLLQGNWSFKVQSDAWPIPIGKDDEQRWLVKGNEITWTSTKGEEVKASFTIDPAKSPKQIDLAFLSGPDKGKKSVGIYDQVKLARKPLWFCLTEPGSDAARPAEFKYEKDAGRALIGLDPVTQVPPAKPAENVTPDVKSRAANDAQVRSGLTPGDYHGSLQVMQIGGDGSITYGDGQVLAGMTLHDDDRLKIAFRDEDEIWTDMTLPLVSSPGPRQRAAWSAEFLGYVYHVTAIPFSDKGCVFRLEKRQDGKLIDGSQAYFAIKSKRATGQPDAGNDPPIPKNLEEWRVDQRTTGVVAGQYTGAQQAMRIAADGAITYSDRPQGICHIEVLEDDRLKATFKDSRGEPQIVTLPLVTPANKGRASWSAEIDGYTLRATAIPYSSNVYVFRLEKLLDGKLTEGTQEFYGIEQKLRKATPEERGSSTVDSNQLDHLQGTWAVDSCESEAGSLKVSEWDAQRWRWTIKGNEISWGREGQQWRLAAKLDPSTTPKQMDLTFLDGPHKGETCLGIYERSGDEGKNLRIRMQDPGAKVARPTDFAWQAGSQTSRIALHSIPPIDPMKELASFQGTWCWDFSQPWTWPQPIGIGTDGDGRKSEKRWVIEGNRITWVGRDGQRVYVNFTIDPFKAPKQIEFTFLNGTYHGKKSIGIYEPQNGNENNRWLCMTDPGSEAPRPTDISASSFKKQSMISIYKVAPPAKPSAANELKRLQGIWQMQLCDSTHKTLGGTQQEVLKWQWTIKDDVILWNRQGEVWMLKLNVDPPKSPREIDLTFLAAPFEMDLTYLDGPFKGAKCRGIFGWEGVDRQSLMIAIQDPGSDAPRPTKFYMSSDFKTGLMILRPSKPSDAEREIGAFQGTWTLRNFDTGKFERNKDPSFWPIPGGKGPDKSGDGSELRWTVKGHEITWTSPAGNEIKASFTIDPDQAPKQIDLTFQSGPYKGETCPGIYQRGDLDENVLWICLADPGRNTRRPKEFSYQWGEGRSVMSFYPFESSVTPSSKP